MSKDDPTKKPFENILYRDEVYPDPISIFQHKVKPLEQIKDECLFVLDTNVLLVPYNTGKQSLETIKEKYEQLVKEKRLFVPAQVAREFAANRPEKICNIIKELSDLLSRYTLKPATYPLLDAMPEYQSLTEKQKLVDDALSAYRTELKSLIQKMKALNWDDPVSTVYAEVFQKECIIELTDKNEELIKEHESRLKHRRPPAFQDANKSDKGIGDFLIWKTIIKLGSEHEKHIVLVSHDLKNDWFHQSMGEGIFPRHELVDEFRDASKGSSFHIIQLSYFLELFKSEKQTVNAVRDAEEKHFFLDETSVTWDPPSNW